LHFILFYLVRCVYPYAQSPSGRCVNILIDFNNCGTVGYVCPANYTSCSAGFCSAAPTIQLTDAIPIFIAAINGSIDDKVYHVTVPFSITLYNTTTYSVQVTTNGVSFHSVWPLEKEREHLWNPKLKLAMSREAMISKLCRNRVLYFSYSQFEYQEFIDVRVKRLLLIPVARCWLSMFFSSSSLLIKTIYQMEASLFSVNDNVHSYI
jgi:hypothetical protein